MQRKMKESDWRARIRALPAPRRAELARRAVAAPLFAHAYAFHLTMRFGGMTPSALLDFAAGYGLAGVMIHVEDGENRSLLAASREERAAFGDKAHTLGLRLQIETSATDEATLAAAIAVALQTGAEALRCYPRHAGRVSTVIARTIADLQALDRLDPERRLAVVVEQHEDLTSAELMQILDTVGDPRLSLLFDFGNMINAGETPLQALATQAGRITRAHVKDCIAVADRGGFGHRACPTGEGELPIAALLVELLLLGEDTPQVTAFGLEEEDGYVSPAFRFPGEDADPVIPARGASLTALDGEPVSRLERERRLALRQIETVRAMLSDIAATATGRSIAQP